MPLFHWSDSSTRNDNDMDADFFHGTINRHHATNQTNQRVIPQRQREPLIPTARLVPINHIDLPFSSERKVIVPNLVSRFPSRIRRILIPHVTPRLSSTCFDPFPSIAKSNKSLLSQLYNASAWICIHVTGVDSSDANAIWFNLESLTFCDEKGIQQLTEKFSKIDSDTPNYDHPLYHLYSIISKSQSLFSLNSYVFLRRSPAFRNATITPEFTVCRVSKPTTGRGPRLTSVEQLIMRKNLTDAPQIKPNYGFNEFYSHLVQSYDHKVYDSNTDHLIMFRLLTPKKLHLGVIALSSRLFYSRVIDVEFTDILHVSIWSNRIFIFTHDQSSYPVFFQVWKFELKQEQEEEDTCTTTTTDSSVDGDVGRFGEHLFSLEDMYQNIPLVQVNIRSYYVPPVSYHSSVCQCGRKIFWFGGKINYYDRIEISSRLVVYDCLFETWENVIVDPNNGEFSSSIQPRAKSLLFQVWQLDPNTKTILPQKKYYDHGITRVAFYGGKQEIDLSKLVDENRITVCQIYERGYRFSNRSAYDKFSDVLIRCNE